MNQLPLQGIRLLDFCWVVAGPYACMLLAGLGAEVIRVESHERTDLMRRSVVWPLHEPSPVRVPPNQGMLYNYANRMKKSITLDLTKQEGIELAKRLVAVSDAVVDNMRPDAMIKMGLGYDALRRVKPDMLALHKPRPEKSQHRRHRPKRVLVESGIGTFGHRLEAHEHPC